MHQTQHTPLHPEARVPSDARELMLALNPARVDVPQLARHAAAIWASQWMEAEPDAIIAIGCNDRARNSDERTRQLRLRRLSAALQRQGVPAERIRCASAGLQIPVCSRVGERGVAWLKVMQPLALEKGVVQIEALFGAEASRGERSS